MDTRMKLPASVLVVLASMLLVQNVAGHGYMSIPASRNAMGSLGFSGNPVNSDLMSLAAGGPGTVGEGGARWPNGKNGLCGDPWNSAQQHMQGGRYANGIITKDITAGTDFEFEVVITAHHWGSYGFNLCDLGANGLEEVTQDCLNQYQLERSDGSGPWTHLGAPPSKLPAYYKAKYRIPSSITSGHVVVQWHWVTGNSCHPPMTPKDQQTGTDLGTCGLVYAYPEEFWNCADARIIGGDGGPPPERTPTKRPTPTTGGGGGGVPTPTMRPTPTSGGGGGGGGGSGGCCDGKPNGLHLDPNTPNCGGFCNCVNGHGSVQLCPPGLRFNEAGGYCDWPANVPCSSAKDLGEQSPFGVDPASKDVIKTSFGDVFVEGEEDPKGTCCKGGLDGVFLDLSSSNCQGFCQCVNDIATKYKCGKGRAFNPVSQYCEWKTSFSCSKTKAQQKCCIDKEPGTYPYKDDPSCRQFCTCSNHETIIASCAPSERFNPKLGVCDAKKNVKCSTDKSTPTKKPTKTKKAKPTKTKKPTNTKKPTKTKKPTHTRKP